MWFCCTTAYVAKKGQTKVSYCITLSFKSKKGHLCIWRESATSEWDKERITQICVKRDQKAQCSFLDLFTGRPFGSTLLTQSISKIAAIFIHLIIRATGLYRNELAWDIAVKSKGSGLRGSQTFMRGCGDERPEGAYKLSFTKALQLYYHPLQLRLNNGYKWDQLYKWFINANAA